MAKRQPSSRSPQGKASRGNKPVPSKGNWRRYRHWLIFVPVIPIVALLVLYSSIVYGFTPPSDLMAGTQGLEIVDRNGQPLFTFGDEPGSGRVIPLSEVSPDLINATVAVEDAGFWKNPGVSPFGFLRAAYENLAFWENGGFFKGSGGSSITQQLAKNLYIKPQDRYKRSPVRKVKEALIAFELNRRYSKQQILEWYLSNTYYGHGAYGVDSASHRYFNKAPKDLTLPEAALLAGLPQAPSVYDPLNDMDSAMVRQKQVLNLMAKRNFLDQAQLAEVLAKPVGVTEGKDPGAAAKSAFLAPHFAAYVRELLPQLLEKPKLSAGLKVTTTIDASLQSKAESIVTAQLDKFEKQYGATNGALVSIDPTTGEILAMVGSHDFMREDISGQVNNALALNEPGSTMKPVTYLTAMLKGWAPATIVVDEPIKLANGEAGSFTLGNADKKYRGSIPVRTALGSSLNVPAVKALEYVGLEQVYAMAKRMGVSSLNSLSNYGPAFTLGGVDVNLLDMTYVYSVLAGQGEQAGIASTLESGKDSRPLDPIAVLKVQSSDGKVLWQAKGRKERIVPANAAYLVTNILSDDSARVSMFGANSPLNLSGRQAAVKSGSSDETRDLWAIGYTPQLVTGVWVGNANNKPMTGATSAYVAAPIWNAFMTAALQGKPAVNFPVPSDVEYANVCATSGQAPTNNCPSVVKEVFMAGRLPSGVKSLSAAPVTPTRALVSPTPRNSGPGPSGGLLPTPTQQSGNPGGPSGGLLPTPMPSPTRVPPTPQPPRQRSNDEDDRPGRANPSNQGAPAPTSTRPRGGF
ncbi:MAG TPA: transglycosylase domain-containing protein [Dehalococcoidia bacterium]|nr:transglycosylase domain-containing protein [Dehalococcoidia bacterium]